MKICDRCFHKDGSAKIAVDRIKFLSDAIELDLCVTCKTETLDFVENPVKPKKRGPKPKKDR